MVVHADDFSNPEQSVSHYKCVEILGRFGADRPDYLGIAQGRLPKFWIPDTIRFIWQMLITSAEKIIKAALRATVIPKQKPH